eukprot:355089-Chlamydomonas_euryale.AAC.1
MSSSTFTPEAGMSSPGNPSIQCPLSSSQTSPVASVNSSHPRPICRLRCKPEHSICPFFQPDFPSRQCEQSTLASKDDMSALQTRALNLPFLLARLPQSPVEQSTLASKDDMSSALQTRALNPPFLLASRQGMV